MIGRKACMVSVALLLVSLGCNDDAERTSRSATGRLPNAAPSSSGAGASVPSASANAAPESQSPSSQRFTRIIAQPVEDFVLQGRQVWARTELPAAPGGGRPGKVHHFDGRGWNSYPLHDSRAGHLAERFLVGPGASLRLVGLDIDCCAMAEVVGVRWLGGRWGPLTSANHGLPKNTDLAPQFELAAVAGDPAILCHDSLLPLPCYSLRGGRWGVIRDADGRGSADFVAISRRAGRTIAWLNDAFYSLTVKNEWKRIEDVPARALGYDGTPWLHIGSHGELWCGCCGRDHECGVEAWDPKSKEWHARPVGLNESTAMLQRAPDDAWVVGEDGVSHFDGKSWKRISALPGGYALVKEGLDGLIWLAGDEGLWRGRSARTPAEQHVKVEPVKLADKRELPLAAQPEVALEATTGSIEVGRTLAWGMKGAWQEGQDTVWFYDDEGLWRRRRDRVERIDRLRISDLLRCRRCGTSTASGSWEIWSGAVRFHDSDPRSSGARRRRLRRSVAPGIVYRPRAIRAARDESVWVVGEDQDGLGTSAARYVRGRWQRVVVPGAHVYDDVFPVSESEAWIVGGEATTAGPKSEPVGVFVHVTSQGAQSVHVPGALLHGVSILPDGAAVAAGDAGTVVVWKSSGAARWHLRSRTALLRVERVRDALLVAGEGGTLLRFDGTTWSPLAPPGVGHHTLSDVLATPTATWILGPTYLARVSHPAKP
jgi:hypothetical protein